MSGRSVGNQALTPMNKTICVEVTSLGPGSDSLLSVCALGQSFLLLDLSGRGRVF